MINIKLKLNTKLNIKQIIYKNKNMIISCHSKLESLKKLKITHKMIFLIDLFNNHNHQNY
jgi:hypothetical protein